MIFYNKRVSNLKRVDQILEKLLPVLIQLIKQEKLIYQNAKNAYKPKEEIHETEKKEMFPYVFEKLFTQYRP